MPHSKKANILLQVDFDTVNRIESGDNVKTETLKVFGYQVELGE
ncbi:MAG: hypothetical protein AB8G05_15910 [Oligoflexales bacterium]